MAIALAFVLAGCGGSGGGESSDNNLLDENTTPVAYDQNLTTREDTPVAVVLRASDRDGDPLRYRIVQPPAHGQLTGSAPNLRYLPATDFHGEDRFTFLADDGAHRSAPAQVRITIVPVNDPPIAYDQNLTTRENTPVACTLQGQDPDGDSLRYEVIQPPRHGRLEGEAPRLRYVPETGYSGEDRFRYRVGDGHAASDPATVRIRITHINKAPVTRDDRASTDEDTPVAIDVLANDRDPDGRLDPASLTIVFAPQNGTVEVRNATVRYTPSADFSGTDRFAYTVRDDAGASSAPTPVTITVRPLNDPPVAVEDNATVTEGKALSIPALRNDYDPDDPTQSLKVVAISAPRYGKARIYDNQVVYSAVDVQRSDDELRYTIEDPHGARSEGLIRIRIRPVNTPPTAKSFEVNTTEEKSVAFTLEGDDPDGDTLHYRQLYAEYVPTYGRIEMQGDRVRYVPAKDFSGDDYLVYVAEDAQYTSAPAAVTIHVLPQNDPPVADAGPDQEGIAGDSFVLDGTGSYDPDGNLSAYEWREGDTVLSREVRFEHRFFDAGTHRIVLRVWDEQNASASDEAVITVRPCCTGCVYPDPTATDPFN